MGIKTSTVGIRLFNMSGKGMAQSSPIAEWSDIEGDLMRLNIQTTILNEV